MHSTYCKIEFKMSGRCITAFIKTNFSFSNLASHYRPLHTSQSLCIVQSGRVKVSPKRNKPVTYEDALSPSHIAHRKSWNSWNTSTIEGGILPSRDLINDLFIRKFIYGTFPGLLLSKVIIKRQYNMIRVAAVLKTGMKPPTLAFLIGYAEELLSFWLQSIVKLEFQFVRSGKIMIFKKV